MVNSRNNSDISVLIRECKENASEKISLGINDIRYSMMLLCFNNDENGLNNLLENYENWWLQSEYSGTNRDQSKQDVLELFDYFAYLADIPVLQALGKIPDKHINERYLYNLCSESLIGPVRAFFRNRTDYMSESPEKRPDTCPGIDPHLVKGIAKYGPNSVN